MTHLTSSRVPAKTMTSVLLSTLATTFFRAVAAVRSIELTALMSSTRPFSRSFLTSAWICSLSRLALPNQSGALMRKIFMAEGSVAERPSSRHSDAQVLWRCGVTTPSYCISPGWRRISTMRSLLVRRMKTKRENAMAAKMPWITPRKAVARKATESARKSETPRVRSLTSSRIIFQSISETTATKRITFSTGSGITERAGAAM
mmetsp:Transcript_128363/g.363240  ORF Transcript_128363/g.363240 Transcript_128363/m.363240 type:complete len:204 (+) Transcript_128363:737-1348(+)